MILLFACSHGNGVIDVKIRHVFGDTLITEASIGVAPPGNNIAQWDQFAPCFLLQRWRRALSPDIAKLSVYNVTRMEFTDTM